MSLAAATGCAAVLGLDETTRREDVPDAAEASTPIVEAGVETDASVDADATTPEAPLALAPSTVLVRRGATATFTVTLTRTSSTPASLGVTLADLPNGVTASTATIGPGQTSATVTVTASAVAAIGAKAVRAVTTTGAPVLGGSATLLVATNAGSLDVSFDGDGLVADATKGQASAFHALAVQSDGKILAGGVVGGPGPSVSGGWLLRRFDAAGAADAAFAAATISLPVDGEIRALALDGNGRIYAAGTSNAGPGGLAQLTVVRVLPTGAIDTSFGTAGVTRLATVDAPSGSTGLGLALDATGVYAVGARVEDGGQSGIVVRLKTVDGKRDTAWNAGAVRVVEQNRLVGAAGEGDGRVTVGGTDFANGNASYYLARLQVDGGLDTTFGTFGTSIFPVSYRANGFARLPSGALVLVGDVAPGGGLYTAGLRTSVGASLFSGTFGGATGAAFYGVAPVGNLGFVAAGHASGPDGEARVTRVLSDGGADPGFANGAAILDPGGSANGYDVTLQAVALDNDGRILVAGRKTGAGAVVYRLWP